ncbi:hypothetical protein N9Z27_02775 [Alphaproteobacteria bacterium]|nr:hypothetical protein [Alphaproteobacteria bacterium]
MNTKNLIQSVQNSFSTPTPKLLLNPTQKNSGGRNPEGKPATASFSKRISQAERVWFKENQINDNANVIKKSFPKIAATVSLVAFLVLFTLAGTSIAPQETALPDENIMISMMEGNPGELATMLNSLQVGE